MSTIKGLDKAPSFFSMNDTFCNKRNIRNGFSSRIWINKEKLINTLNSEIRDEIIRRADYRQMSKIIQNRLGVGANDAYWLVVTESAFVMNQANKQAFMDAGIKRYEVNVVMDRRTSPTCRSLNGKHLNLLMQRLVLTIRRFIRFAGLLLCQLRMEILYKVKMNHGILVVRFPVH